MKRRSLALGVLSIFIVGALSLVGCGSDKNSKNETVTLKVGASATPHAEILEHIKPALKKEGINLKVVVLDSDDQLNPALAEKQIDANYFQHLPYLESVEKEKGYKFEVAGSIHVEPIGFYSNKIKSIKELKSGDKIGIPNNPSNEYRALKLLEANGLIKLKSGITNYAATPNDIVENKLKLEFIEADAAQLPRSLDDLAGAVINTNHVLESGLKPESALFRESGDSPYANIVVVRDGDTKKAAIKKLIAALKTDDVKEFIKKKYGVAVVPAF